MANNDNLIIIIQYSVNEYVLIEKSEPDNLADN